jgi:hypothetical protein
MSNHDAFWGKLAKEGDVEEASDPSPVDFSGPASSLDTFLGGHALGGGNTTSVRALFASEEDLVFPLEAGTRVSFVGGPQALLSYSNAPMPGSEATVVMVRKGSVDGTGHGGKVFTLWEDGLFRAISQDHLCRAAFSKKASSFSRRVGTLGDLGGFVQADDSGDLVHRATKDLWSLSQDGEGFLLQRLFNETGDPLKV